MIAQAKSIAYGHTYCLYISGEAASKKEPEKVTHISDHMVSPFLSALSLYQELKDACRCRPKVSNTVMRIVVSPSPEHTKNFTVEDWQDLWDEFVREFDSIELTNESGEVYSPHTNVAGSRHSVWLHEESNSGIPHLHAAVARVDEDGNLNNDHDIHLRAQRAAEKVALNRGWRTAADIRNSNLKDVTAMCFDALRQMDRWSMDDYISIIESHGFDVKTREDKDGNIRGYILKKGNARYKASEISRKLTMRYIEDTWRTLHNQQPLNIDTVVSPATNVQKDHVAIDSQPIHETQKSNEFLVSKPGTSPISFAMNGDIQTVHIPNDVLGIFDTVFAQYDDDEILTLKGIAAALFTLMIGGTEVAYVEGGGGGSSNNQDWGREKDDDDKKWAHKCANAAASHYGKPRKSRSRKQ